MSRITLSDLIKRGIHNPPDGTRTLALGGVVGTSTGLMYNNYNKALQPKALSKTSAIDVGDLTQKLKEKAKSYAKDKLLKKYFPEYGQKAFDVTYGGGQGLKVELNGPHNPILETYDNLKTLDDDPGNHKKKALVGMAGVGAGAAIALAANARAMREAAESVTTPQGTDPKSKAYMAAGMAIPAALYYIYRNTDRPGRQGLGAGVLAGAIQHQDEFRQQAGFSGMQDVPPDVRAQLGLASTGVLLATTSGVYTAHQLQAAADEAKLRALGTSGASEVEKAKEINRIRAKKDFLTRYPVFRPSPYAERFRGWYNKFHKPSPVVSKADYDKYIAPHTKD